MSEQDTSTLIHAIHTFDGKHTDKLANALSALDDIPEDDVYALAVSDITTLQDAATWVIKTLVGNGRWNTAITPLFAIAMNWPSKLHLAQCVQHLPELEGNRGTIAPVLFRWIKDDNTFLRAWAYDALWHLSENDEKLRAEVLPLIVEAADNDKASVRARLRKLIG